MELAKIVKTGDWLFVSGNSLISKLIKKATAGNVNHVGIVSEGTKIFETDLAWGKAEYHDIAKYNDRKVIVIRPVFSKNPQIVDQLCKKYEGTPYSIWDIVVNATLSWMKDAWRKHLMTITGNKKFMICSELTGRVTYEATGYKALKDFEGMTPQDLLVMARMRPTDFRVIYEAP